MLRIDINSDMGEQPEALRDGSEEALMKCITSANIACGVHAGDEATMNAVVSLALRYGVSIGAHPSYPDRENFGRMEISLSSDEIRRCVYDQVKQLAQIAKRHKAEIVHVKPHGALYNVAVKDSSVAEAVGLGVKNFSKSLILFGLAGSKMLDIWKELGFRVAGEAFADRAYEPDRSLRSRKFSDALITDPEQAAKQAVRIAKEETVIAVDGSTLRLRAQTICLHSDTPGSTLIATAVHKVLRDAGIQIVPISQILSA